MRHLGRGREGELWPCEANKPGEVRLRVALTSQYNDLLQETRSGGVESERLSPVSGRRAFDAPEALPLLQKGVILFQRKVHD